MLIIIATEDLLQVCKSDIWALLMKHTVKSKRLYLASSNYFKLQIMLNSHFGNLGRFRVVSGQSQNYNRVHRSCSFNIDIHCVLILYYLILHARVGSNLIPL